MKDEDPYYRKNLDEAKKIASEKFGFQLNDSQMVSFALNRFVMYDEWRLRREEKINKYGTRELTKGK